MSLSHRTIALRLLLGVMLSSLSLSCKDYEYTSPLPGMLEVRLKVVNARQVYIPFGPTNFYPMVLKEINATVGDIKQPIFSDYYAIRRNDDGDLFNFLDTLARDSSYILGQTYLPPLTYDGVDLTVKQWGIMILKTRDRFVVIHGDTIIAPVPDTLLVNAPLPPSPPVATFFKLARTFDIKEGRLTIITVTYDMDASFVRTTNAFDHYPVFYVSSVKNN